MGLFSKDLVKRTRSITIGYDSSGEPVEFVVSAPSLTLFKQLEVEVPEPVAPILRINNQPVRQVDEKGLQVIRNGTPAYERDEKDKAYLARVQRRENLMNIGMVLSCAVTPMNVVAKRDQFVSAELFYEAVWIEFEKSGLDWAGWKILVNETAGMASDIGRKEEIKAARKALMSDADSQINLKADLSDKQQQEVGPGK